MMGTHLSSNARTREKFANSERLKSFSAFIRLNSHILTRQPCLTFQLALNDPDDSPVHTAAVKGLKENVANPHSKLILPPYVFVWSNKTKEPILSLKENPSHVTCSCIENDAKIKPRKGWQLLECQTAPL